MSLTREEGESILSALDFFCTESYRCIISACEDNCRGTCILRYFVLCIIYMYTCPNLETCGGNMQIGVKYVELNI